MKRRLSRLFGEDGRSLILAIDHGSISPVPALARIGDVIEGTAPYVDGFMVNLGVGLAFRDRFGGKGLCLRADVAKADLDEGSLRVFGPGEAMAVGASALIHMLYPGHFSEAQILLNCATLIAEALEEDLPVIVEAIPEGLGMTKAYTAEAIGFAVRQAAELGAAAVKTAYPTGASHEEFQAIVESSFVPVLVLGGAAMGNEEELLQLVRKAMDGGAAGVAIGRNIWQHANPPLMAKRVAALVHDNATVAAALKISL